MTSEAKVRDALQTYGAISALADVRRHNSTTFDADRRENVAEHSYSLTVFGAALAHELNQTNEQQLDVGKVTQYAAVHDLTEAYMEEGDISVYASKDLLAAKKESEAHALEKLEDMTRGYPWIATTIKEYGRQTDAEARFVYALDKIVVHMNVILSGRHHAKPAFAAYEETEKVAKAKIAGAYPELLPIFEELCQVFRASPHFFKEENGLHDGNSGSAQLE